MHRGEVAHVVTATLGLRDHMVGSVSARLAALAADPVVALEDGLADAVPSLGSDPSARS